MMKLKSFVFNAFQVNCFVLYDDSSECIIVDASCYEEDEYNSLFSFIEKNSLKPKALLNTHGHVDHLTGTKRVCEKYGINFFMHRGDNSLLENAVLHGKIFGFSIQPPPEPHGWIADGDFFSFGNSGITAWHAPGHSPGSLIFYEKDSKILITGDVLFAGSIGRTDLSGGNFNTLIDSINTKILILPDDTQIFPGHGPASFVGIEKEQNPFLNRSS